MRLRCGGYQGEASVHTRALRALTAELRTASIDGDIVADITEQGRKAADLLGMVEGDELDLCYFSSSYLAARVLALAALDVPFLIADRERAYRALDSAAGHRLADDVARTTGFRVLAFWDNGFRHFSNRVRPIRTPEDCRGLKIRTLDNTLHQEVFRALGFEPVQIDVKDLVRAVASGVVDAQENPLTNTLNFGIHRTHRHISLTAHFFGVALLLVNRARFDGWPAGVRDALLAAAASATRLQRSLAAAEDMDCLARLRAEGCEILTADALDRVAFEAVVAPIRRRELARIEPELAAAF
jgi:TRAP-type C4-dicarboxylate transport system substrate-binding protein